MLETTERPRAFRPEMAGELGSNTRQPGWDLATERRIDDGETLAGVLGWLSIGLGAVQLLAPERLGRWLGTDNHALVQGYGLGKIATGIGILSTRRPTEWIWARAAGDALDLATLAAALDSDNPHRGNVGLAMGAVAGVTMLDVLCGMQLSRRRDH